VTREEGGTPAIVESIRAGLVFALKDAVGTDVIAAAEERHWRRALRRWSANPAIEVLGNPDADRLSIVSLRVRHGRRYLHHNYVIALLNDLFGIQARGGCSCAGPYGHRLLAIDTQQSHEFRDEIAHGCEGVKPGWIRVNFNYFISDTVGEYLVDAIDLIGHYGHRLLADYRFDPRTGLWQHHRRPPEPVVQLAELGRVMTESPGPSRHPVTVGEEVLAQYLTYAGDLMRERPDPLDDRPSGLAADFEALRWFHLPAACVLDGQTVTLGGECR
jgi:hypothetical protein